MQLVPAGPFLRFFALLLDHLLLLALFLGVSVIAALASVKLPSELSEGILLFLYAVAIFAIYNGYFFLGELLLRGQTPGKLALGLRVLRPDGSEPDMSALLIRNLLRPGDMFPFLAGVWVFHLPTYAVGGVLSLVLTHFRRGGDLAAGTIVVYERSRAAGSLRIAGAAAVDGRPADTHRLYALRRPDPTLLDAVARFMERRDRISPARREEIARDVHGDLKRIFAWSGPEPTPEKLIEMIYASCVKG